MRSTCAGPAFYCPHVGSCVGAFCAPGPYETRSLFSRVCEMCIGTQGTFAPASWRSLGLCAARFTRQHTACDLLHTPPATMASCVHRGVQLDRSGQTLGDGVHCPIALAPEHPPPRLFTVAGCYSGCAQCNPSAQTIFPVSVRRPPCNRRARAAAACITVRWTALALAAAATAIRRRRLAALPTLTEVAAAARSLALSPATGAPRPLRTPVSTGGRRPHFYGSFLPTLLPAHGRTTFLSHGAVTGTGALPPAPRAPPGQHHFTDIVCARAGCVAL